MKEKIKMGVFIFMFLFMGMVLTYDINLSFKQIKTSKNILDSLRKEKLKLEIIILKQELNK